MDSFSFLTIIFLLLIMALYVSALLMKRAIVKVIGIFCRNDALGFNQAKTLDELGLRPPSLLQRMTQMRDYKPYALDMLIKKEIVRMTRDGKLYLREDKLGGQVRCATILTN